MLKFIDWNEITLHSVNLTLRVTDFLNTFLRFQNQKFHLKSYLKLQDAYFKIIKKAVIRTKSEPFLYTQ